MSEPPIKPPTTKPAATARRAVVFAFSQRYLAFVVQLGTSVILARFLTPLETGVFSLAVAAVAIGAILREFGTSDYIISQKDMTPEKLRAAYTVTISIAWSIAAVLFVLAYPLAALYKEPGVADVMHVLCLNFFLVPLGSTATAVLAKELRFDTLFWMQTSATVVSAVVTVLCAVYGFSSTSPAWGSVAGISTTIAFLLYRSPGAVFMRPTFQHLRQVVRFGGTVTASKLVEGVSTRCDDFIVSGMLGFHASGLLSKSNSLNAGFYSFFASAVVSVATPVIAQARHSNRAVDDGYRRALTMMASVQWLFFGLMGIGAHEIIWVLFGKNWLEAVPILQIGAIQGLLYAPFMLCTPLLTAFGAATVQLRANLIFGVVLATCLALGALHSLLMAATLSVLAHIVRMLLLGQATQAVCGISTWSVVRGLGPTALVCSAAAVVAWVTRWGLVSLDLPAVLVLAGTVVAAVACFLAGALLVQHPVTAEIKRLFASLRPRKVSA